MYLALAAFAVPVEALRFAAVLMALVLAAACLRVVVLPQDIGTPRNRKLHGALERMAEKLGFRRESCHVSPGGLGVPPDVMDRRRRRPPGESLSDAEQDARLLDRRGHGGDDRPGRVRVVQRGDSQVPRSRGDGRGGDVDGFLLPGVHDLARSARVDVLL